MEANLGILVGIVGVFLPAFLVIDVLGANVELNASEHVLLADVTLVEHQRSVEIVLNDLLHANEGGCDRSMTGEGFGPRVFNGDPQNWVAVIFHIVRVYELIFCVDVCRKWISVVGRESRGHELLVSTVLHTHGD